MLVSRRLCCASLNSKSVISTVRGMPFLRNNSVGLNQLCRASPVNGETKISGYETLTPNESGSEKPLDLDRSPYLYRVGGSDTVPFCSFSYPTCPTSSPAHL